MLTAKTRSRPVLVLLILLLFAFTAAACLAPDEPMVLSSEGDAVEEGTMAEVTPGEEPAIVVDEADVAVLATDEPEEEGTTPDEVMVANVGLKNVLVSANYLINRDVENQAGDVIADVDDLLIDLNTGQILYVIVNYGDFLDLTTEDRPIPLSAFGWNQELELVLKVPEEMLESVPAVEDEWPLYEDAEWNRAALTFWQDQEFAPEFDAEAAPVRATDLIGIHAGQLGADLGVVEDLLLDLNAQRVAYLGVFTANDFYSPDLVLLVPMAATTLTVEAVDSQAFYGITLLEIDREVLRAAPALDRSIFSTVDFVDQTFTQELNTYWSEQGLEVEAAQ